jgi:hypothetical protein
VFVGFNKQWKKPSRWPNARTRLPEGTVAHEAEDAKMLALVQLEASQSGCGSTYRLTLGIFMPQLASVIGFLSRLF